MVPLKEKHFSLRMPLALRFHSCSLHLVQHVLVSACSFKFLNSDEQPAWFLWRCVALLFLPTACSLWFPECFSVCGVASLCGTQPAYLCLQDQQRPAGGHPASLHLKLQACLTFPITISLPRQKHGVILGTYPLYSPPHSFFRSSQLFWVSPAF